VHGAEMADSPPGERRHCYNHRMSERWCHGFPEIVHYDTLLIDLLQPLVEENRGALKYPTWPNTADYLRHRPELELELIQSHMAQKPVLRGEVECACVAREVSVERGGMGERGCARRLGGWHRPRLDWTRQAVGQQHPSPLCAGSEARRRAVVVSNPCREKTLASQHLVPELVHRARRLIVTASARRSLVATWPLTTLTPVVLSPFSPFSPSINQLLPDTRSFPGKYYRPR